MTIEQRFQRLERQCRLFKAGFALVTVALAAVLFIGAGQDKKDQDKPKVLEEVRAKAFKLVDGAGKQLARLALNKYGGSELILQDENGIERAWLQVFKSGRSDMGLSNAKENGFAYFHITKEGKPKMGLKYEKGGEIRMDFGWHKDDTRPSLLFLNKNRNATICIKHSEDGEPRLILCNKDGRDWAYLRASGEGTPALSFYGIPSMSFYDKEGNQRAWLFLTPEGEPGIQLKDKSGKVIFKAPE